MSRAELTSPPLCIRPRHYAEEPGEDRLHAHEGGLAREWLRHRPAALIGDFAVEGTRDLSQVDTETHGSPASSRNRGWPAITLVARRLPRSWASMRRWRDMPNASPAALRRRTEVRARWACRLSTPASLEFGGRYAFPCEFISTAARPRFTRHRTDRDGVTRRGRHGGSSRGCCRAGLCRLKADLRQLMARLRVRGPNRPVRSREGCIAD